MAYACHAPALFPTISRSSVEASETAQICPVQLDIAATLSCAVLLSNTRNAIQKQQKGAFPFEPKLTIKLNNYPAHPKPPKIQLHCAILGRHCERAFSASQLPPLHFLLRCNISDTAIAAVPVVEADTTLPTEKSRCCSTRKNIPDNPIA